MDDTLRQSEETIQLERGIQQLNAGDTSVRGELLNIACHRLLRLTSRLRHDFQRNELRGEDDVQSTENVFHNATARLYQALHDTPIKDVRHFYRLAAIQIRRELIELCRHYQDVEPVDDSPSDRMSKDELRQWAHFHDSVDSLAEGQREVFELIWYHEMTRGEVAELLGVPITGVRRLWRNARLGLNELLDDESFPTNETRD